MDTKGNALVLVIVLMAMALTYAAFSFGSSDNEIQPVQTEITPIVQKAESTQLLSTDFVSYVDNKYFTLTPGKKYIYQSVTDDGTEMIEVFVTSDTKKIMGVNAIVVWDREWLNGELVEDTKDWFAQDKFGNVWEDGSTTWLMH